MWIRVISLRSRTARLFYVFLAFVGISFAMHPHIPAATQPVTAPVATPVYRVQTSEPDVALTINVVWGTEYVPKLLQILTQNHVRATFMLGGAWAAANPELVRTMVADHMEIGNHGYSHRHSNLLSESQNLSEITRTNAAVEAITGTAPKVFAPPYGEFDQKVLQAAASLHMPVIMWTVDTIDWRPSSTPAIITSRVLTRIRPGGIVLMHPTDRTVEALPSILHGLSAKSLKPVTISELLSVGTPKGDGQ